MEILGVIAISIVGGGFGGFIGFLVTHALKKPVVQNAISQVPGLLSGKKGKKKPIVRDDAQAWHKENDRETGQAT